MNERYESPMVASPDKASQFFSALSCRRQTAYSGNTPPAAAAPWCAGAFVFSRQRPLAG
jgi:hypothetical protein